MSRPHTARLHAQDGLAEYRLRPLHANPLVCGRATPAYLGRLVSRTPENASHVFPTFGVLAGKSLAKSALTLPRFKESLRGRRGAPPLPLVP